MRYSREIADHLYTHLNEVHHDYVNAGHSRIWNLRLLHEAHLVHVLCHIVDKFSIEISSQNSECNYRLDFYFGLNLCV